jgi:hypothetical protein
VIHDFDQTRILSFWTFRFRDSNPFHLTQHDRLSFRPQYINTPSRSIVCVDAHRSAKSMPQAGKANPIVHCQINSSQYIKSGCQVLPLAVPSSISFHRCRYDEVFLTPGLSFHRMPQPDVYASTSHSTSSGFRSVSSSMIVQTLTCPFSSTYGTHQLLLSIVSSLSCSHGMM